MTSCKKWFADILSKVVLAIAVCLIGVLAIPVCIFFLLSDDGIVFISISATNAGAIMGYIIRISPQI